MNEIKIKPIAEVLSPYQTKFGTPRQSGLVKSDNSKLAFNSDIPMDAFEKLIEGNFIWVVFIFDQCEGNAKYQVRPPRLGGNQKIGVYATRSPFRPNNIGLSLCKIKKIVKQQNGVELTVEGLDLANKTPVIDIKPYHPTYDKAWSDSEYWFGEAQVNSYEVIYPENTKLNKADQQFITEVLSGDPRPAYHDDENRVYKIQLKHYDISFQVKNEKVIINEIGLL